MQCLSCIYIPYRYTQTASFTLWSSPLVSPSVCFSWVSLSYLNVNSLGQGLFPVVCRTLPTAVQPESLFLAEQGSTHCMMCPPWRCLHKAHCKSHPSGAHYWVTKERMMLMRFVIWTETGLWFSELLKPRNSSTSRYLKNAALHVERQAGRAGD